jgi:hypothetical protein
VGDDSAFGLRFALASLAVWRVSHLLAEEDGPGDAVVRLRLRLGQGRLGELADCFYCLSVWVAAPASLVVAERRREVPLVWLALSGAACLLEQATSAEIAERKGEDNGLLWSEAEGVEGEPADAREPARSASRRLAEAELAPAAGR